MFVCVGMCVSEGEEEGGCRQANLSSTEPTSKLWRANNLPNWIQSSLTTGGTQASGSIKYGEGWWRWRWRWWREEYVCVCLYRQDEKEEGGGFSWHDKWARKGKEDKYKKYKKERANTGLEKTTMTNRQGEEEERGAWRFLWLRGGGAVQGARD